MVVSVKNTRGDNSSGANINNITLKPLVLKNTEAREPPEGFATRRRNALIAVFEVRTVVKHVLKYNKIFWKGIIFPEIDFLCYIYMCKSVLIYFQVGIWLKKNSNDCYYCSLTLLKNKMVIISPGIAFFFFFVLVLLLVGIILFYIAL